MNSVPTRNKRSRESRVNSSFRRAVVFSPLNRSTEGLGGSQHRLGTIVAKARAENLGIENVKQLSRISVQGALDEKRSEAQERLAATAADLKEAQSKAADESLAVGTLRSQLKVLKETEDETSKVIHESNCKIDRLKTENERFKKMIEVFEEQTQSTGRSIVIKANRLQQQMSLYAGMTQIKWFFKAQELESDFLIGQVNDELHSVTRGFKIDSVVNSKFAVASILWRLVYGEDPLALGVADESNPGDRSGWNL